MITKDTIPLQGEVADGNIIEIKHGDNAITTYMVQTLTTLLQGTEESSAIE